MYNSREKILNKKGTELEEQLAKFIYDFEMKSEGKLKECLSHFYILSASKLEYKDRANNKKEVILIKIPYRSNASYQKIRSDVIKNLEKKFKGSNVVVVAQRTIQSKF